jgi:hypothetical protein
MTFEADHGAPLEAGFEALTSLLRLIADPKSYQRQLDALMAASTRMREEAVGADRARAALAQAKLEHDAACAEREAKADELVALGANRQAEADRKEARLDRIAKDIREHDKRLRLEVMRFSNLMPHFSEKLMELPDWGALADEVLDKPAPLDPRVEADELEAVPVENLVAGATITRSGRQTMRRVES